MNQLPLFRVVDPPFDSDRSRGVWFWTATRDGERVTFSNRPHPRLPHHCPIHRWWSSHACESDHSMAGVADLIAHRERPVGRGHEEK